MSCCHGVACQNFRSEAKWALSAMNARTFDFCISNSLAWKKSEKEEKSGSETEAFVSPARGRGQSGVRADKAPPCLRCGGLAPTTNQPTTNAIFEMRKMKTLLISTSRKKLILPKQNYVRSVKRWCVGQTVFFGVSKSGI